jgi:hypothetical protein
MRKKGVGRAQRVRAVDRDTRALQGDRYKKKSVHCIFLVVKEERMVDDVG